MFLNFAHYMLQNSMTPYSTATMPLGLGGGGALGGETLKPVIPPFLPQPSYELTAETWGMPTQQKSQSTLDLTVVGFTLYSCLAHVEFKIGNFRFIKQFVNYTQ